MITRIFRVRVPKQFHAEFEERFTTVSLPLVQGARGLISVAIGRPTLWEPEEYVMVSVWQTESDIASFAGERWNQPVIPHGMEQYVSKCWVHHYENFG
jgi:heme-degrading monooxygenase HmoA